MRNSPRERSERHGRRISFADTYNDLHTKYKAVLHLDARSIHNIQEIKLILARRISGPLGPISVECQPSKHQSSFVSSLALLAACVGQGWKEGDTKQATRDALTFGEIGSEYTLYPVKQYFSLSMFSLSREPKQIILAIR